MDNVMINPAEIPFNYLVCIDDNCLRADHCMRRLAERAMPQEKASAVILRPHFLKGMKQECTHFKAYQLGRYAKGFKAILGRLPLDDSKRVTSLLCTHFGRRTYYNMRNGSRLTSPQEQLEIRSIIKQYAATEVGEFDGYELKVMW